MGKPKSVFTSAMPRLTGQTPTPTTPTVSPITISNSWLPTSHPQFHLLSSGVNITGEFGSPAQVSFFSSKPLAFTPDTHYAMPTGSIYTQTQYDAMYEKHGKEIADKLATQTKIPPHEVNALSESVIGKLTEPNFEQFVTNEIVENNKIESDQRLDKVRPIPSIPIPSSPTPSTRNFMPFVILGILGLVFILIWRA